MYNFKTKNLGNYDVCVCGGGIAGVGAAYTAAQNGAKVVLVESHGSLGGTVTEGIMGNIMDGKNKGGLISELYKFLNDRSMTCANKGSKTDNNGNLIPGRVIDVEGAKFFFEKILSDAGVEILYASTVTAVDHTYGHINSILISTYCGNYEISAQVYIDATGNGNLADLTDLEWECGNPPNPASLSITVGGLPDDYNGTESAAEKDAYAKMIEEAGFSVSAEQISVKRNPDLNTWSVGYNFEYNVMPDDIKRYSKAIIDARKEAFGMIDAHKTIKGYENVHIKETASYLGVREGRRVFGQYRISLDDIVEGRRFDDGICLVTIPVDLHKITPDDTTECSRGIKTKPYHIPLRALIPMGSDNMILAGRCISGDFYPFASYRVIGNMATVGQAAGYTAALCVKNAILPNDVDGKVVHNYMKSLGNEL